ncbi:MAG TPA: PAS domain-containing protein [Chthoniobacterales bacterium]|nr:PAS domain-containing protein [Chthoniobacterales bacterium]
MSWVTFIWALVIGGCVIMALPNLLVGLRSRAWENVFFVLAALSVAGIASGELTIMHARTIEEIGRAQRWTHLPVFTLLVAIAGFVYFYFGTGRLWLGIAACLARFASLAINFAAPSNLNFREITGVRLFDFLGETVAAPEGVISAWTRLGELSSLLLLIFVIDASVTLWRRGSSENRRRAAVVGGSITLFIVLAAGLSALIHLRVLNIPYLISLPFLGVVLAMGFELSYEILRAAQTARQLRASEVALRESDTRMNLAASAANLALWVWDIEKDDIWITEKGRELFGFAKNESIAFTQFLGVVHKDDRARMQQLVQDALARGSEYESEYRIVRADGKTMWVAGYGQVELDAQGKPGCMRGVSRDITKRKMAEEALRESEARFRTVADVAPVMIWMSDTDKKGVFFNKGWLEFTGQTVDDEMGAGWLKGVHAEDLPHCLDVCGIAFSKREPFTVEYRLRRRDGEYRWLLDTGTPRFEADGTFLGYIGSCIDIGQRKQAELDHQLQSMELARVGRLALMGELAASLAHEVNNPLGAMVTNASAGQRLLSHGQLRTEELRDLLADIVADGHRAREVIQGIRNMVRKGEASHSLVDIQEVIRDLLRIVRADAIARNVSLIAEVDPNAGVVLGDRVQLLQVLLNLTMNAFEALTVIRADARRVIIRAEPAENENICVRVRDTGPGFPDGIVEQLFEAFFSTKAEGTGMGLAIARSIIEAHGGTLSGENCANGGALFTICLPEAREEKSQAA